MVPVTVWEDCGSNPMLGSKFILIFSFNQQKFLRRQSRMQNLRFEEKWFLHLYEIEEKNWQRSGKEVTDPAVKALTRALDKLLRLSPLYL